MKMFNALYVEMLTFIKKKSVLVISFAVLAVYFVFLNASYNNTYSILNSNYTFYLEGIEAAKNAGADYEDTIFAKETADTLTMLENYNDINNGITFFIGIGLLLIPIIAAIYIGGEYSNSEIERKQVEYKKQYIISAKMIILFCYVLIMNIIASVFSMLVSRYHYNENKELIDELYKLCEHKELKRNYAIVGVAVFVIFLYTLIVFVISYYLKSTVAGIVSSITIVYAEGYVTNSFMPRWLCNSLINSCARVYQKSFAEFKVSDKVAAFEPITTVMILMVYVIILVVLSLMKKKV